MNYSIPYILITLFFLFIACIQIGMPLNKSSRRYLNFLVVIAYILFWGGRGFIGWDWYSYYPFYTSLPTFGVELYKVPDFDLGFVFYARLIKSIFPSYEVFIFINTFINAVLLYIVLKRYVGIKYIALSFALFIAFNGLTLETDLLRNIKALLIFLLAIKYLEARKPIKYFSLIVIAFIFHWSALFFAPLYFFLHKEFSIRSIIIIIVLGTLIYLLQVEYITAVIEKTATFLPNNLQTKVIAYIHDPMYNKSYASVFGFVERTATAFLVLFYYNRLKENKTNILFINSFVIYISIFLYFSELSVVLARLAGNFGYSYWILIPLLIDYSKNSKDKFIIYILFSIIIVAKTHLLTNSIFYDYKSFFFNKPKSYKEQVETFKKNHPILKKTDKTRK